MEMSQVEQGLLWVQNVPSFTPSATFIELAEPLPSVPQSELLNLVPNATLIFHPHLFKIVTPINVNYLQTLPAAHPNQPLVESMCCGLWEGFWPFAKFDKLTSDTWDNSTCKLKALNLDFMLKQ